MYVSGFQADSVHQYGLSTAWDVSTATFAKSYSVLSQNGIVLSVHFRPDGGAFYCTDNGADKVTQYEIGPADFSLTSQGSSRSDIFFKSDGTVMYITEVAGRRIYFYDLSTAWDITTATYNNYSYVLDSGETTLTGLFFKPDGKAIYQIGTGTDTVKEWTFSTAWDFSTNSAGNTFQVGNQDTAPTGIFFRSDGTKMYIVGGTGDDINEYNLSTGWDLTTASYSQNFSVATQTAFPNGVSFKYDGTKMYVGGNNSVWEYALSTAWDISTASLSKELTLTDEGPTGVSGIFFDSRGENLYVQTSAGVWHYGV
jgi:sugar lactone lactonase YvrE